MGFRLRFGVEVGVEDEVGGRLRLGLRCLNYRYMLLMINYPSRNFDQPVLFNHLVSCLLDPGILCIIQSVCLLEFIRFQQEGMNKILFKLNI